MTSAILRSRPVQQELALAGDSIPAMDCRPGCAACCTAPSITSPIPGMPRGKPAGVPCVQLDARQRCRLFGQPERPAVCTSLRPSAEMCGHTRAEATRWLAMLERQTRPNAALAP